MKTKRKKEIEVRLPSKVPFRQTLFAHNASWNLIMKVKNKTYSEFIKECEDPDLLKEVMMIRKNDPKFPGLKKIQKIIHYSAYAAAVAAFFRGQSIKNKVTCWIYRIFMPKKETSS